MPYRKALQGGGSERKEGARGGDPSHGEDCACQSLGHPLESQTSMELTGMGRNVQFRQEVPEGSQTRNTRNLKLTDQKGVSQRSPLSVNWEISGQVQSEARSLQKARTERPGDQPTPPGHRGGLGSSLFL